MHGEVAFFFCPVFQPQSGQGLPAEGGKRSWPRLQRSHRSLSIDRPKTELILLEGNEEQSRETGKEQLMGWPGGEPWTMLGSQHGQAGKPPATCSPSPHPSRDDICNSIFLFSVCHSDHPFGFPKRHELSWCQGADSHSHSQALDFKTIDCKLKTTLILFFLRLFQLRARDACSLSVEKKWISVTAFYRKINGK